MEKKGVAPSVYDGHENKKGVALFCMEKKGVAPFENNYEGRGN